MSDEIARVTRSQGPSSEQWDDLQPVIERYYKIQNKTADEVRKILQQQYGLTVTIKQFKQHIRKWRFDKKFKRKEMIFSLRKIQQRKRSGKTTRIAIRGEVLTEVRLNYYFKRRPMTAQEQLEPDAPTPTDVCYSTPKDERCNEEASALNEALENVSSHTTVPDLFERQSPCLRDSSETAIASASTSDPSRLDVVPFVNAAAIPSISSLQYSLSPQEIFLRQLYEHVRLSTVTGNEIVLLPKRPKFDTRSILRASGWYDSFLNDAIEADKTGHQDVSRSIIAKCANIVAAEVDGYFPHLCLLEMVEIVHYLQLRGFQTLQLQFMYALYDNVAHRLGQFHPLIELVTCATQGYTCSLSPTLIPTMLDFLDRQSSSEVSLNTLLPLFAFQELRTIDSIPRDLLLHLRPSKKQLCDNCLAAIDTSPFVSTAFRGWVHRQFINLLNDVWVQPDAETTAAFHAITRSRVWRYVLKYERMAERRQELQQMPFKKRFWAVSRICSEIVSKLIERAFLSYDKLLTRFENVNNTIKQGAKRIVITEDDLMSLWTDSPQAALFDVELCTDGCEHDRCEGAMLALRYWVGEEFCCM